MHWIATGTGHEIAIEDDRIVARNGKQKRLKSVPAAARKSDAYAELEMVQDRLAAHQEEVRSSVETWLLRSLPVPTGLIGATWPDPVWQSWLRDLVVTGAESGTTGFLRSASDTTLGVVDLDGESVALSDPAVFLPHPALLEDRADLVEFAAEIGAEPRFDQLHREVFTRPSPPPSEEVTSLDDWSGGEFEELRHALSRARNGGFVVQGGYAKARIHEQGRLVEACYWIGDEDPDGETWTEELRWQVGETTLPVGEVGPVAYSEGVRMATHIYAGRKIEEDDK